MPWVEEKLFKFWCENLKVMVTVAVSKLAEVK